MAADNVNDEFHLTPTGWKNGRHAYLADLVGVDPERPSDTVRTIVRNIYQRSTWSREETSYETTWTDSNAEPKLVSTLESKFPRP